jgi:hypothetical protein
MKCSPLRAGRLLRAAICGLLVAAALPAFASADATQSFSFPVSGPLMDSCTGEPFMFTGVDRISFQVQTDGTLKTQTYLNGTGVSLSGVQYTSTEENHFWIFGPDSEEIAFYDYQKLNRSGEVSSPLGGDDFFFRIFVSFPVKAGVPDMNSLNSAVDGTCR